MHRIGINPPADRPAHLSGPWAEDDEVAFIRLHMSFPNEYPELKPPLFELDETAGVSRRRREEMTLFLNRIGNMHARKGRLRWKRV